MTRKYGDLRPVIVTAPTARNGITLIQRLLNSTRQIIVYGENKHLCEWIPELVFNVAGIHAKLRQNVEEVRQRFLTDTTEFWSSTLWPDTGLYYRETLVGFYRLLEVYQECSQRYGFQRWGLKHPFNSPAHLERFMTLVPQGLFIFIYRNLYDVARSSKARRFAQTPEDFAQMATNWRTGLCAARAAQRPNLLMVRMEDLVADPEPWITNLEQFTGVHNVDRTVMSRKFNTFRGPTQQGYSPTEYIEPEPLTETEAAMLDKHAGDVLAEEHYTDASQEPVLAGA
jgi:hypothetical protein